MSKREDFSQERLLREYLIPLSFAEVRAILEKRKTQVRRVIKPQPPDVSSLCGPEVYEPVAERCGEEVPGEPIFGVYSADGEWGIRCPYGQPGDRLLVKEEWCEYGKGRYIYRADYVDGLGPLADGIGGPWCSSIYMPRRASRITLELTDVRVHRVQDITESDAMAEGVAGVAEFASLWDLLNGKKYPWASNPWVWALTFKLVETKQ